MYDIEQILNDWKKESPIDEHHLDDSSRETSKLHAKYLEILTKSRLTKRRLEAQLEKLQSKKYRYYMGHMDVNEVRELGWNLDPTNGVKILKSEVNYYFKQDEDLHLISAKIDLIEETIATVSEIIDTLKWRHQTIKNMISWRQFTSGV